MPIRDCRSSHGSEFLDPERRASWASRSIVEGAVAADCEVSGTLASERVRGLLCPSTARGGCPFCSSEFEMAARSRIWTLRALLQIVLPWVQNIS